MIATELISRWEIGPLKGFFTNAKALLSYYTCKSF